jgi:outer membrane protein OmpA-like peptidoglycan-associated protein
MNQKWIGAAVLAAALVTGACATKGFVRRSTEPIQTQVDDVARKQSQQGELLDRTIQDVERSKVAIGETKEAVKLADNKATEANTKAEGAGVKATQNARDLEALRNVVANIDDFDVASEKVVYFALNQDKLSDEAVTTLDEVAGALPNGKRFFFAIEGFTDSTGTDDYNLVLSRRRAERVVNYLVAKHNVPVFKIYNIGLGKERPAEEGNTREARAKNRRVEIRLYTADLPPTTQAKND